MYPLIVPSRATSLEGLWIPKTYGSFEDGNAKDSNYTITGDTEIKELGGRLKIFFHNIDLKVRKKPKTREEKAKEITFFFLHRFLLKFVRNGQSFYRERRSRAEVKGKAKEMTLFFSTGSF